MPRIKYYFDPETNQYERARLTWKSAFKTILKYGAVSAVVVAAFFAWRFYLYDSDKEKVLKDQITELESSKVQFEQQIVQLESKIDELHRKDNEFHRAMMNLPPIDDGMWNGGTGGTVESNPLNSESMQEIEEKLELIDMKVRMQSSSLSNLYKAWDEKKKEMTRVPSIRPISGSLVSGFGYRSHPLLGIKKLHTGLDFACPEGTPVYATGDGVVAYVGRRNNGYGIHIDLDHGFGYKTKYAHLSEVKVGNGQSVQRGDIIGYSGNTGLSKGPHLHYEIIQNGTKINPIDYFYSDLSPEEFVEIKKLAEQENESMD